MNNRIMRPSESWRYLVHVGLGCVRRTVKDNEGDSQEHSHTTMLLRKHKTNESEKQSNAHTGLSSPRNGLKRAFVAHSPIYLRHKKDKVNFCAWKWILTRPTEVKENFPSYWITRSSKWAPVFGLAKENFIRGSGRVVCSKVTEICSLTSEWKLNHVGDVRTYGEVLRR